MVVSGDEFIGHLVETKGFSGAATVEYKPFTHSIGYQKKGGSDNADAGGAAAAELVLKLQRRYSRMLRLDLPIESTLPTITYPNIH
jgi:hypothetical protein